MRLLRQTREEDDLLGAGLLREEGGEPPSFCWMRTEFDTPWNSKARIAAFTFRRPLGIMEK